MRGVPTVVLLRTYMSVFIGVAEMAVIFVPCTYWCTGREDTRLSKNREKENMYIHTLVPPHFLRGTFIFGSFMLHGVRDDFHPFRDRVGIHASTF